MKLNFLNEMNIWFLYQEELFTIVELRFIISVIVDILTNKQRENS